MRQNSKTKKFGLEMVKENEWNRVAGPRVDQRPIL